MCDFLSAIVFRNGDIYCDPTYTDSHEALILRHGLAESYMREWVRVEYRPHNYATAADVESYRVRLDETGRYSWFDAEAVASRLKITVSKMIFNDKAKELPPGTWILGKDAEVEYVIYGRIIANFGRIKVLGGRATVGYHYGHINEMREHSLIENMYGTVGCCRSTIERMREKSHLEELRGYGRVGVMWDSSRIDTLAGFSTVCERTSSTRIGTRGKSARVLGEN